jgi:hypothetical protein
MMHDEISFWLAVECDVFVSRSTVCRLLKRNKWTRKNIARLSLSRSEELREAYIEEMKKYTAEDLVFLDGAIFNEKTDGDTAGMDRRVNAFNTPPIPLGVIHMSLWQQLHLMAGYPVQY